MSDPESISSGRSLPQWMKGRADNRFDIDGAPFSPPSHDDSFFYIRYPINNGTKSTSANTASATAATATTNGTTTSTSGDINTLTSVLKNSLGVSTVTSGAGKQSPAANAAHHGQQHIDFSKHTEPCKKFISGINNDLSSKALTASEAADNFVTSIKGQKKSHGTDDGFTGAGAACGSSIVRVAKQMVSAGCGTNHNLANRGFSIASFEEADIEEIEKLDNDTFSQSEEMTHSTAARQLVRRGSKSLPASPMSSPKTARKMVHQNPYFTGQFTPALNTTSENKGWFLMSLLGIQREATSTHSVTSQIDEEAIDATNNRATDPNLHSDNKKINDSPVKILKAKPSELREMNFWSPTSM